MKKYDVEKIENGLENILHLNNFDEKTAGHEVIEILRVLTKAGNTNYILDLSTIKGNQAYLIASLVQGFAERENISVRQYGLNLKTISQYGRNSKVDQRTYSDKDSALKAYLPKN